MSWVIRAVSVGAVVSVSASLLTCVPAQAAVVAPPPAQAVDPVAVGTAVAGRQAATLPAVTPAAATSVPDVRAARIRVKYPKAFNKSVALRRRVRKVTKTVTVTGGSGQLAIRGFKKTKSRKIGSSPFAVQLSPVGTATTTTKISMDMAGVWAAGGGSFGQRLRLMAFGTCILQTKPGLDCQGKWLNTKRSKKYWLSAKVKIAGAPVIVAAVDGPSSETGDYRMLQQSESESWAHGGASGAFTYSVGVPTVPNVGGSAPSVSLNYSSQLPDSETARSNGQSGWMGEGWQYDPGSITQEYVPCDHDGIATVGDLCWKTVPSYNNPALPSAHITLNGQSSELIWDTGQKTWRMQNDLGWRISRLGGGSNGTNDKSYWKVDDLSGNQYWLGLGNSPEGKTNSVGLVPVIGNNPGEPCHGGSDSQCNEGTEFHLDKMQDANGNITYYTYTQETNIFYSVKFGKEEAYTAAIYPKTIFYGYNATQNASDTEQARVQFSLQGRCTAASNPLASPNPWNHLDPALCPNLYSMSAAKRAEQGKNFPDVPVDLICTGSDPESTCTNLTSPVFFMTQRFASVTTKVRSTAGRQSSCDDPNYQCVNTIAASFNLPDKDGGSDTAPDMWMQAVQRKGEVGTDSELDDAMTTFGYTQLRNLAPNQSKVKTADKQLRRGRMTSVNTASGSKITINYSQLNDACQPANLQSNKQKAANPYLCFPVYSQESTLSDPEWLFYNKYVVTSVVTDDQVTPEAATNTVTTTYQYPGNPSWAWENSMVERSKYETWDQYRGYNVVDTVNTQGGVSRAIYYRGMKGGNDEPASLDSFPVRNINGGTDVVQDDPQFAGMLAQTQTLLAGQPIAWSTNTYQAAFTDTNGPPGSPQHDPAIVTNTEASTAREQNGAIQSSTTSTKWSGPGAGSAVVIYQLPTQRSTTYAGPDQPQATCVDTLYQNPTITTANIFIGLPFRVSTYGGSQCSGQVLAQRITRWDNLAGWSQPVSRGNVTEVQDWTVSGDESACVNNSYSYDGWGRIATQTDPGNVTTTYTYNAASGSDLYPNTIDKSFPGPNSTTWKTQSVVRAGDGVVTQTTDQNNHITASPYDSLSRPVAVASAGVTQTAYTYPVLGDAQTRTSPAFVHTSSALSGGTRTDSYTYYNGNGQVQTTQSAAVDASGYASTTNQIVSATYYDSVGRASVSIPGDSVVGQPANGIAIPDQASVDLAVVTGYDAVNRPTSQTTQNRGATKFSTSYTYDTVGQMLTTPPTGGASRTITNVAGQTTSSIAYSANNGTGTSRATTYGYDALGDMTTLSHGGQSWQYSYDQIGRRVKAVDPDTGTTTYAYNPSSSLLSTTSPAGTVSMTYDSLQRPVDTSQGSTLLSHNEYDPSGDFGVQKSSTVYSGGQAYTTFTDSWDAWYRPLDTKFNIEAGTVPQTLASVVNHYVQSYAYNDAGEVTSTGYTGTDSSNPAETVATGLSSLGLPTTLSTSDTAIVTGTGYSPIGELNGRVWAAGAHATLTRALNWDPVLRVPSSVSTWARTDSGQTRLSDDRLSYDSLARPVSDVDAVGSQAQCYQYSGFSELTAAWTLPSSDGTVSCGDAPTVTSRTWVAPGTGAATPYISTWGFDPSTGNMTSRDDGNVTDLPHPSATAYSYTTPGHTNALTTAATTSGSATTTTSFGYDASGDRSTREVSGSPSSDQSLSWNVLGQPTTISSGGSSTSMVYGSDGTRMVRDDPTSVVVYAGDTQFTLAKSSSQVTIRREYTLGGSVVGVRDTSVSAHVWWMATDTQGSANIQADPAALSATTGWVRSSYTPYGDQRVAGPGAWTGDYTWLNKPNDTSTGYVQTDHRLYDSSIGQFISPDPLLQTTSPNPYAYASNNPIAGSDPSGLFCFVGTCGPDSGWCIGTCGADDTQGLIGGGSDSSSDSSNKPWTPHQAHNVYECGSPRCGSSSSGHSGSDYQLQHQSLSNSYGTRVANQVMNYSQTHNQRIPAASPASGGTTRLALNIAIGVLGIADILQFGLDPITDLAEAGLITTLDKIGADEAELNATETAPRFSNLAPDDVVQSFNRIPNGQLSKVSGQFNYVVKPDGELVVGRQFNGHIDLAQGGEVTAAGRVRVVNGEVKWFDNASGHYQPSGPSVPIIARGAFEGQGLKVPDGAYRPVG